MLYIDKNPQAKVVNQDLKKWQENWEDEEINDNFEEILKNELTKSGQLS